MAEPSAASRCSTTSSSTPARGPRAGRPSPSTRSPQRGTQIICATHSPILASVPGANILELGEWGIRHAEWADLEIVTHWRSYLDEPGRYLRHLLA